jgi:hypothetical protein
MQTAKLKFGLCFVVVVVVVFFRFTTYYLSLF